MASIFHDALVFSYYANIEKFSDTKKFEMLRILHGKFHENKTVAKLYEK